MSKNNFKINCPECGQVTDLYEEAFEKSNTQLGDNLFKDTDCIIFNCVHCGIELAIVPEAIWSYAVEKVED
jgi:predicted RNA-binding Zn-ribbon protein involved in translation (DUF1610 family)